MPPRHYQFLDTAKRWFWDGNRIVWQPTRPPDAHLREATVRKLLELITNETHEKPLSFLKLSGTSKTGATWSLPAVAACPTTDETCGNCYALDGFYRTSLFAQLEGFADWSISKCSSERAVSRSGSIG